MSYTYTTGDGWSVLLPAEPDGATEAVAILDNAVRQIKAFINDETSGLGKILGSTGQIKTLVIGTALPTPAAADRYWFYSTSLNGLYFCSSGVFLPVFPTGGVSTGKVLTAAGAGVLPTWSYPQSNRIFVILASAPATGSAVQLTLQIESGSHAAISIVAGKIRIATGYKVLIKGISCPYAYNGTTTPSFIGDLIDPTPTIIQRAAIGNTSYMGVGFFDCEYSNSSGSSKDVGLYYTTSGGAVALAVSSTSIPVRLSLEVFAL